MSIDSAFNRVVQRNPNEPLFHQAVREFFDAVAPVLEKRPDIVQAKILERIAEPERVIMFTVPWVDDRGEVQVNKGFRVEMSSVLGPFMGGLRFHPSVNLGTFKFLAFDQVLRNSLTTLPMGAASGGSDFNPKGMSDREVLRFCRSYMTELWRYLGADTDLPSGDIGVGPREIGYLQGTYQRLANRSVNVVGGKRFDWGEPLQRQVATGYGAVYFGQEMLKTRGRSIEGMGCLISGSGEVALAAAEKVADLGGKVLSLSDASGFIFFADGLDKEKLAHVRRLKTVERRSVREYVEREQHGVFTPFDFSQGFNPLWSHAADIALPCATQNELNEQDARNLVKNGVACVVEGASMPVTREAATVFLESHVLFGPDKASNAGGGVVAGLERAQQGVSLGWTRAELDQRLQHVMTRIHENILATAKTFGTGEEQLNYVEGANFAAFLRVANAMLDAGVG
ncbi:NADP-specific glutamate dehydrogenase [Planctomycetota bacterium]